MAGDIRVEVLVLVCVLSLGLTFATLLLPSKEYRLEIPVYNGTIDFDGAKAFEFAYKLSKQFPYRPTGSKGIEEAFRWLHEVLKSLGYEVYVQEFNVTIESARAVARNLYVIKEGKLREAIVILTNYDMAPTSWEAASDTSGAVGVVLQLARELSNIDTKRAIIFAFVDAEEWGMHGARYFIEKYGGPELKVVIVAEDLAPGGIRSFSAESNGQFKGYSPLWLRVLVREVVSLEGYELLNPTGLLELVYRSIGKSFTDQGPILAKGISAIQVGTQSDDPELARRVYHSPEDIMENMRLDSFYAYGRVIKRLVLSLDVSDRIPGYDDWYLSIKPTVYTPGWAVLASTMPLLLPSAYITLLALRPLSSDKRGVLMGFIEILGYFALGLVGIAVIYASMYMGFIPRYEVYPPPPRHPLLYNPNMLLLSLAIGIPLLGSIILYRMVKYPVSPEAFGVAMIIGLLLGILYNHYGVLLFLTLPSILWPLYMVTRNFYLRLCLTLGGAVVFLVLLVVFSQVLDLGPFIVWYLYLGIAYGQWGVIGVALAVWFIAIFLYLIFHLRD